MQLLEVDANSLIVFVLFFIIRGTAIELDVVLTNDHGGSSFCSLFRLYVCSQSQPRL